MACSACPKFRAAAPPPGSTRVASVRHRVANPAQEAELVARYPGWHLSRVRVGHATILTFTPPKA